MTNISNNKNKRWFLYEAVVVVVVLMILSIGFFALEHVSFTNRYIPQSDESMEDQENTAKHAVASLFESPELVDQCKMIRWDLVLGKDSSFLFFFSIDKIWYQNYVDLNDVIEISGGKALYLYEDKDWLWGSRPVLLSDRKIYLLDSVGEMQFWIVYEEDGMVGVAGVRKEVLTRMPKVVWDIYK